MATRKTTPPRAQVVETAVAAAKRSAKTADVFKDLRAAAAKAKAAPKKEAAERRRATKLQERATSEGATKTALSKARVKYMELTGQTPLEFLTAVYRNQLYTEYQTMIVDQARGLSRAEPKQDEAGNIIADQIHCPATMRMAAAIAAAPYVHRKQPIGIDGGEGKPLIPYNSEALKTLTDSELDAALALTAKLNGEEAAG